MNAASTDQLLVIGVGNEFRGDDGVGLYAIRKIEEAAMPGVIVREQSGEGAALMECWKDFTRVIAIDATSSGSPPGTIHRLDASETPIPSEFFHYSTHAFSLAEAVELARALSSMPPSLVIYGIEGKTFSAGSGLSAEVQQAADEVVRKLITEMAGVVRLPIGKT